PAQEGGYRPVSTEASPWTAPGRPAPYLVWTGGAAGGLTLTLPGGFRRPVPYDEIAELLSRDPVLSARRLDVDVVLAASKAAPVNPVASAGPGRGPAATGAPHPDPRAVISAATGRGVWASRGGASLVEARPHLYVPSLLPLVPGSRAAGDWAAVRPRDLLPGGAPAPLGDTGVVFAGADPASDPVSEPTSDLT
ncbi:hypothetical protein GT042_15335, partial [Streptomyces sp. SID3212]|nr:hypothetical protein [Streptomyces sp. SID3212]